MLSLVESDSFHSLSELVEATLPQSLNYSHVILYRYDSEKSLLIIEKQKMKISHILNDGLISNAIKNNQPIMINRNNQNIKFDDFNSVFSTALSASKITNEVKSSNLMIEDMSEVVEFISSVTNLNEITNITSQINEKLKKKS